jgi:hypothetical protein
MDRVAGVFPGTSAIHHDCRVAVQGAYDAFISIQIEIMFYLSIAAENH